MSAPEKSTRGGAGRGQGRKKGSGTGGKTVTLSMSMDPVAAAEIKRRRAGRPLGKYITEQLGLPTAE